MASWTGVAFPPGTARGAAASLAGFACLRIGFLTAILWLRLVEMVVLRTPSPLFSGRLLFLDLSYQVLEIFRRESCGHRGAQELW